METHRLTIPDEFGGGWVDIKAKRGWARLKDTEGKALVVHPDADVEGGYSATVDLLKQGLAKLEDAVIAWSLPLPANRSGFMSEDLDEELPEWLIDAIDDYYASRKRTDEERKTSAGISTAP